jgi:colanic acid/amylovoran biosynthesis glycosyltransferase
MARLRLLVIAPWLPKLSETFVYREVLGLQSQGLEVMAASVHDPGRHWQEPTLRHLAQEAIPVYGLGSWSMLGEAMKEVLRQPRRAWQTLALALGDALRAREMRPLARFKIFWQCLAALALASRLRGREPDHLHAQMAHVSTSIAMYAAHQMGLGFSFSGHAADLFRDASLLREKLQRADFVRCISHWHRAFYQGLVPRPDQAYPVVRCGVPLDGPQRGPGRPLNPLPLLLGVGRLVPKKGFDVLIRALAEVATAGQVCRCRILGDGPERASLEALVAELGLTGVVELAGARDNPEILAALPEADLFVLPCRTGADGDKDGIPVVLMEAMAAGLCSISGDLETIRELIRDGETGFLVPAEDVQALAQRILGLLQDDALREQTAARGQAWVRQEFGLEPNLLRFQQALQSVLPKGGEAP